MLQTYQFRRLMKKVPPLMLVAINHESLEPPAFPGGPPKRSQPVGKNQLYLSSLRLRTLKAEYHQSIPWLGMKMPGVVEFGYEIEGQQGPTMPRYVDTKDCSGNFQVGQVGFNKGKVLDQEFWFKMGREVGYIRTKEGKIQLGDEDSGFSTKDELIQYWISEREKYHQAQDDILPLALQFRDTLEYVAPKKKKKGEGNGAG